MFSSRFDTKLIPIVRTIRQESKTESRENPKRTINNERD